MHIGGEKCCATLRNVGRRQSVLRIAVLCGSDGVAEVCCESRNGAEGVGERLLVNVCFGKGELLDLVEGGGSGWRGCGEEGRQV